MRLTPELWYVFGAMGQFAEKEEDAYQEMEKAFKSVCPSLS